MKATNEVKGLKTWHVGLSIIITLIVISSAIYAFGKAAGMKTSVDKVQNVKIQVNSNDIHDVKEDFKETKDEIVEIKLEQKEISVGVKTLVKREEQRSGKRVVDDAREEVIDEMDNGDGQ